MDPVKKLSLFQRIQSVFRRIQARQDANVIQPDDNDSEITFNLATYMPLFSSPRVLNEDEKQLLNDPSYQDISQISPPPLEPIDEFVRTASPSAGKIVSTPLPLNRNLFDDWSSSPNPQSTFRTTDAPDRTDTIPTKYSRVENNILVQSIKDSFRDKIEPDRSTRDNLHANTSDLASGKQAVEGDQKIQPFECMGQTGKSSGSDHPTAGTCKPTNLSIFSKMSSASKLDKFKGGGSQDVNAWLTNFFQWSIFHDLPNDKIVDTFPFHLEGHAKIWYDALPIHQKSTDLNTITMSFKDRFTELENFLDLSVLQMKQGLTEGVNDF